jgi:nitroreductase
MEFYEVIEKRRTICVFKEPAKEEQLRRILLAGTKAPSGGNRQPWEFIIVDDEKLIDQLAELKYQHGMAASSQPGKSLTEVEEMALEQKNALRNASIVMICSKAGDLPSAWLCIENISLAAVAEGLGCGIVTYRGKPKEAVQKLLRVPEGYELITGLRIGVPAAEGALGNKKPIVPRRTEFSWLHRNVSPEPWGVK